MKTLILLVALLCCSVTLGTIEAQTLVGLPQYGVGLAGTPGDPIVLNNSGKMILAYSILLSDAQKNGVAGIVTDTQSLRTHQAALSDAFADMRIHIQPVRAELDSIVFGDGRFVGPDKGNSITIITAMIDAERRLGSDVFTQQVKWDRLQSMLAQTGPASVLHANLEQDMVLKGTWGAQRMLAQDLLRTHEHDGDAKAFEIANFSRNLPQVSRSLLAKQNIFPILTFPFRLIAALLGGTPSLAQTIEGDWYINTYQGTLDGGISWSTQSQLYYAQTIPYLGWAPGPYTNSYAGNRVTCANYFPGHVINTGLSQHCGCDQGCFVVLQADQGQQIPQPPGYTLATSDWAYDPNDRTWLVSWGEVGEDCLRINGYWIIQPGHKYCSRQ